MRISQVIEKAKSWIFEDKFLKVRRVSKSLYRC